MERIHECIWTGCQDWELICQVRTGEIFRILQFIIKNIVESWNSCTNLTLGIGQDKMLRTPFQLANAMCIIANKGYYYTHILLKR